MDLLHFDPEPLYFEDPLPDGVLELIERAGEHYGAPEAEQALAEAGLKGPDHLPVLGTAAHRSMTLTRFYLSALKAAAYIRLREGDINGAIQILQPLVQIDDADRLGSKVLLDVARAAEEASQTPIAI